MALLLVRSRVGLRLRVEYRVRLGLRIGLRLRAGYRVRLGLRIGLRLRAGYMVRLGLRVYGTVRIKGRSLSKKGHFLNRSLSKRDAI